MSMVRRWGRMVDLSIAHVGSQCSFVGHDVVLHTVDILSCATYIDVSFVGSLGVHVRPLLYSPGFVDGVLRARVPDGCASSARAISASLSWEIR
eukprot:5912836-Pyramimonas_sp.AAC.1